MGDDRALARMAAGLAALFWGVALFLPCIAVDAGENSALYTGFEIAGIGWAGPLAGTVAWYANIPWLIQTLGLARGRSPKLWLAIVSVVLALSMLAIPSMVGANEGSSGPAELKIGAWIWLLSFLPALAIALRNFSRPRP